MKYFNLIALNKAIIRIKEGNITHEHRTGTVANGLANHYFDRDRFVITPEQIQDGTGKRPDLSIEKYITDTNKFIPHCFIEVKSLINSNFPNIVEQLHDTIFITIDDLSFSNGNFSTFVIAMKGTRVAFYVYHSFSSLLDDYGISNYKGFIPLNKLIPKKEFMDFCENSSFFPIAEQVYARYLNRITFSTDNDILAGMGAISTDNIRHSHILDLLNQLHREDIHEMFRFMSEYSASSFFPA